MTGGDGWGKPGRMGARNIAADDSADSGARPRRMLIATNHLKIVSGSEMVVLEIARHFSALGHAITLYASWIAHPLVGTFASIPGLRLTTDRSAIRPLTYDTAYIQHQVLGLFDYAPCADDRAATRIVAGRLSRRSFLESGGWLHDRILVDHVLANSALTAEHLAAVGQETPVTNFRNAAPSAFFRRFEERPAVPRQVLLVSNHADPALMEAAAILRRSMAVDHVGLSGDRIALVTPEMVAGADLVISIGKTVPYALAARVPVYVYDHYGGPGYLGPDTIAAAERYNFSGRCCERTLSGAAIAGEVVGSYARGVAFARQAPAGWLERFRLEPYLDLLLQPPLADNAEKRRRMADSPFLIQERLLASHVCNAYVREQQLAAECGQLRERLRAAGGAAAPPRA